MTLREELGDFKDIVRPGLPELLMEGVRKSEDPLGGIGGVHGTTGVLGGLERTVEGGKRRSLMSLRAS